MKISSLAQLSVDVKKTLAPIYVISSDEVLLKEEAATLIELAARDKLVNEKISLHLEGGKSDELYSLLYASSMLSEKRIVFINSHEKLPDKTILTLLTQYASRVNEDLIVVLLLPKLDARHMNAAWYLALDKIGRTFAIWPIQKHELPAWLIARAKLAGLTMHQDACENLAEDVEGNLLAAAQAIEKLSLLYPKQTITLTHIKELHMDDSQYTVFDLADSLFSENTELTLTILARLKETGAEPVLILWAIVREVRVMTELAESLANGGNIETLFKTHRIFPKRQSDVRRLLREFKASSGKTLLQHAATLDPIIKGYAQGNIWQSFEMFCLRVKSAARSQHAHQK